MGLFSDINEITLLGNATAPVEVRQTKSGTTVGSVTLVTSYEIKRGDSWEKTPTFHSVIIWGNLALRGQERIEKGTRLLIKGRISTSTWEGSQGEKRQKTEIVASEIFLISRYKGGKLPTGQAEPATGSYEDFAEIDPYSIPL
jgi:single-strand DNA-binding protein